MEPNPELPRRRFVEVDQRHIYSRLDRQAAKPSDLLGAPLGHAGRLERGERRADRINGERMTAAQYRARYVGPSEAESALPAEVPTTNARKLHGLKMELDNVIEHDQPGLGVQAGALKSQNRSLSMARGAINDALETQVPGLRAGERDKRAPGEARGSRGERDEALGLRARNALARRSGGPARDDDARRARRASDGPAGAGGREIRADGE